MDRFIQEFINAPYGKGVTALNNKALRTDLEKRFDEMTRKNNPVVIKNVCKDKSSYYVHFLIPSETERQIYYDVVVKFTEPTNHKGGSYVLNWKMQLFSNSPSFSFTFANIYNMNGILIPELKDKYKDEIFDLQPTTRNPITLVNYDKSIYFALYYFMKDKTRLAVIALDKLVNVSLREMKKEIKNMDELTMAYKRETARINELKRLQKQEIKDNKKENEKRASTHNRTKGSTAHIIRPKSKIRPKAKKRK